MYKKLGWSIFISQFDSQKERLSLLYTEGAVVFTSLHIAEEFNDDYEHQAEEMCSYLADLGYRIIADISKRTLTVFHEQDAVKLAKRLHISILRLDYGFSLEETSEIARNIHICLNASTLDAQTIHLLKKDALKIYAMHNYYPRPETGLDTLFFDDINKKLSDYAIDVLSFIPSDTLLRAPLYEGLPTLEKHRSIAPYAAYIDMIFSHKGVGIFVGDGIMSDSEYAHIQHFLDTGIIDIPIIFDSANLNLANNIFTVRPDSPFRVMRLQESREYATKGLSVSPTNIEDRVIGSLTMDNELYARYSGEIQIVRENLPADKRVNIIGKIPLKYHLLLPYVKNNCKIRLCSYTNIDSKLDEGLK